jgi:hypothetical protein
MDKVPRQKDWDDVRLQLRPGLQPPERRGLAMHCPSHLPSLAGAVLRLRAVLSERTWPIHHRRMAPHVNKQPIGIRAISHLEGLDWW